VLLTDGKGNKARASITDDNRKRCTVAVSVITKDEENKNKVAIGISLIKNASRFEWFLEKATEIGVHEIIPLICARTEKEKFRLDRMQQILISAMLQSQQSWMPKLHEPIDFKKLIDPAYSNENIYSNKYIAHCLPEQKTSLREVTSDPNIPTNSIILIGPEGDFTSEEIDLALKNNYKPVTLGTTRLRTETAGMVAATLLCIK
jgi:16S rRNA (uracil1498-N3)-methyltransferase